MSTLPSIYTFNPSNDGGRIARKGFIYQDHVGVRYLLDLALASDDCDILLENEDDLVVIHKTRIPVFVEMIQVKSNNLDSRWSISQLLSKEVLQKSLQRGKCSEEVTYRIITSYDIDSELEVLKHDFSANEREKDKLKTLADGIKSNKKYTIPANAKGHTVDDWVDKCIWSKYPDSIESLYNGNLILLEQVLKNCFSITILTDQKIELCQQLLALVQANSSTGQTLINKVFLQTWFEEQLKQLITPKGGTEKLIEKMGIAGLDSVLIETAKEMKWSFVKETMNNVYSGQSAINKFKLDALSMLQNLKLKLDAGELEISGINDGPSYHKYCVEAIEKLAVEQRIEPAIAKGCMYDITNRCQHRFLKPTA
jgi:hypothetical protein